METKRLKRVIVLLLALLALLILVQFRQTEVASGGSYVTPIAAFEHATVREDTLQSSVPICTSQERLTYIKQQLMTQAVGGRLSMVVVDPLRVAFCHNNKVASGTLSRTIGALGKKISFNVSAVPDSRKHSSRGTVNAKSLNTIEGYRRFVVICNPFDRFVSAYNHVMFTSENIVPRGKLDAWTQRHPSNGTLFQRFTKAVLEGLTDKHWIPQAVRCDFEKAQYNDVMRLESFRHDFEPFLTHHLKANWSTVLAKSLHVLRMNKTEPLQTTVRPRYLPIFQEIPKAELLQLKSFYRDDLRLFGYDFDVDTLMASCSIRTADGRVCC